MTKQAGKHFNKKSTGKTASNTDQEQSRGGLAAGAVTSVRIQRFNDDGNGLAMLGGRSVLVPGSVPGDLCRVRIIHVGRLVSIATLLDLLEQSPDRSVKHLCPDADVCLGCPLISIRPDRQTSIKHDLVLAAFASQKALQGVEIQAMVSPAKALGYRTTAKLVIAGKYREPFIGLYRRQTHDVIDLEGCPVHHPLINTIIATVRDGIRQLKIPIWQERIKTGILRYLVVRVSEATGQAMVTFVTARRSFNEVHHLAALLRSKVPEVTVVSQNVNSSEGNVIFGPHDHFITKDHTLMEKIGECRLAVSPRSFLQAQTDGARVLYQTVRDHAGLTSSSKVLDLYCGIGGIALTVAKKVKSVLGVEVNTEAVADARINARLNMIKNCRFEAGDAAEILENLVEDGEYFDTVVVNPPRRGCDRAVLDQIAAIAPQSIAYVSCSPESLARDLSHLVEAGYSVNLVQPVDMFPQTLHVETVVVLGRNTKK